jgi:hypothetical protein
MHPQVEVGVHRAMAHEPKSNAREKQARKTKQKTKKEKKARTGSPGA